MIDIRTIQKGDWLLYDGKPIRVTEIGRNGDIAGDFLNGNMSYVGNANNFEYLQLTDEVMEANGFKKDGYTNLSWDYIMEDRDFNIFVNLRSTGDKRDVFYVEIRKQPFIREISVGGRNIRKVFMHELQHLLREVGLFEIDELLIGGKKG